MCGRRDGTPHLSDGRSREEPTSTPGRNRTRPNCVVCRLTGTTQGAGALAHGTAVGLQDVVRQPALATVVSRKSHLRRSHHMPRKVTGEVDPAVCPSRGKPIITNPPAQLTHWYDSDHPWSPLARLSSFTNARPYFFFCRPARFCKSSGQQTRSPCNTRLR